MPHFFFQQPACRTLSPIWGGMRASAPRRLASGKSCPQRMHLIRLHLYSADLSYNRCPFFAQALNSKAQRMDSAPASSPTMLNKMQTWDYGAVTARIVERQRDDLHPK